jgi:acyl-CoA synthetase (AMP-forming)/AMP-acid ligase II
MSFNIADVWELAADQFSDREYLVCDQQRRTFRQMEERANQLAHHLQSQGIGPGDHVGIYGLNCVEWIESMFACLKIRAVYVNINFRYVAEELAYIFDNADLKAVIVERQFLSLLDSLRDTLPTLKHVLVIEDGTTQESSDTISLPYDNFDTALASQSIARDFAPRSDDDHYIVYTGGTTGMPKGVVWRHADVMFALGGGVDHMTHVPVSRPEEIIARGDVEQPQVFMSIAPLMHGASQWACIGRGVVGEKIVLTRHFDADSVWQQIANENVNGLFIVGDAMARPLIEAYETAESKPDTSSLFLLTSSGAIMSPAIKDLWLEHFPNLFLIDSFGASEVGGNGMLLVKKGETEMTGGGPTITPQADTVVLHEDSLEILQPGDNTIGKIARRGYIPLGYYKDEKKTAETYVTAADGKRYAIPGDFARMEANGGITILGRGSVSINSGGEKIYPEEVEAALKAHAEIYDCVVVGVPDDTWGNRVAAVAQTRGTNKPTIEEIMTHSRTKLAGYKIPREIHYVDTIPRSPAGKPNYQWAKEIATQANNT